tara:strand:+ start:201 stop:521 length:321 start_codon:yes stop_codon:yes gene_type:complete
MTSKEPWSPMEPWRPHPGALVQIWDYQWERKERGTLEPRISGHGLVGYVVKKTGGSNTYEDNSPGPIFEVICFNDEHESTRHNVWYGWLREIKKTSDIKKVVDNHE